MSAAHAQSAASSPLAAAVSQPAAVAASGDNSTNQALLHTANASYHAHDWFGALIDYQQLYYSDSEHGRPDDRGLGTFAQTRMSLCHTWTGVDALNLGDYATSRSEFSAALDDDNSNAMAQRLLARSNQQYRLLMAVEDMRQPMRDMEDAPDQQAAMDRIRASSAKSSAMLAGLTHGTARQKRAAFRFLQAYNDAFVTNFLLSHAVVSQEAITQDIALSPDQSAPSDDEVVYDLEQMVQTFPQIDDIGQAAFASDDLSEVVQYQPILDAERAQLAQDNEEISGDFYEDLYQQVLGVQEGRGAEMRERQLYLSLKRSEAESEQPIGLDSSMPKP